MSISSKKTSTSFAALVAASIIFAMADAAETQELTTTSAASRSVFIDPDTGKMTSAPAAQEAQKMVVQSKKVDSFVSEPLSGGGTKIHFQGAFIYSKTVTLDADGNLHADHSESTHAEAKDER